jgi:hypothetical protein
MIKCFPATEVEDKIRKQAAELNVPLTQYLVPFLKAIADGQLTLSPTMTLVSSRPTPPPSSPSW